YPFRNTAASSVTFSAATGDTSASAVAPTTAGSAMCVCRVRPAPCGASRWPVRKRSAPVARAWRAHQKFQRPVTLSPYPAPGRCVERCRTSGQVQRTAMPPQTPAAARSGAGARPAAVLSWHQDAAPERPACTIDADLAAHRARPQPSDTVASVSTRTLTGILAPVTTPFGDDGAPDLDAYARNLRHYATTALAGVVVLGSNGEAALLSDAESDALIATARDAFPASKWLIAGTGRESTAATVAATKRAAAAGVD